MNLYTSPTASMPNPTPDMPGTTSIPDLPSIETPIDPGILPDTPSQEPGSMPNID